MAANPTRSGGGLLERAHELDVLHEALAAVRRSGRGRLVLIGGEAGIGKSALAQAFCDGLAGVHVLAGACEALRTPRPLGPLLDIATETRGRLAALVEDGAGAADVLAELLDELRSRSPTVVVLEALHWSDEATLDLLRLLARRIATAPALVLATYRDDELERDHPLRVALGEMARDRVTRLTLPPLSVEAIAELARPYGASAETLHARTGGNPFYVTEALAAGGVTVPDTVRDAVLARAARLGEGARRVLDAVAITPRAELWLLEALAGDDLAHVEECLASGMLHARHDAIAFRHEIARVAVADALPPDRSLALHRAALAELSTGAHQVDTARLAHHAEAAGDASAVLRFARAAGERAAAVGAHREAAAQLARALRFAGGLPSAERAELLDRLSYERYLTASMEDAIEARTQALAEHRRRGDTRREGDSRRWLSRFHWYVGDRDNAQLHAHASVELLERLVPGPELAMAYSNLAQLAMLDSDLAGARAWGGRALELAQALERTDIVVHALNNIGTAELCHGVRDGVARLERSLELALAAGLEDDAARAHSNLASAAIRVRAYPCADRHLAAGLAYASERDLDSCRLYVTGWQARRLLERGRWADAAARAAEVLDHPSAGLPMRVNPLVVVGLLRARRGEPGAWEALDEALVLAEASEELQRLAPVAVARAEARWLAGETELVAAETERALALALERDDPWATAELLVWRRRCGIVDEVVAPAVAEPFRLELTGEPLAAAKRWRALEAPYDAALALLAAEDDAALREAHAAFQRLGARATAARCARLLRERGVRDVSRGPRPATRRNPAGLTARQLEVLELLALGLRNGEIATRLTLSAKTVDHHVSAILRKLRAGTRTEAAAKATRLGLLEGALEREAA